jgi:hypothetical protein
MATVQTRPSTFVWFKRSSDMSSRASCRRKAQSACSQGRAIPRQRELSSAALTSTGLRRRLLRLLHADGLRRTSDGGVRRALLTTKHKLWVVGISGVVLFDVVNHALNPLRWSDENLREWLLERVPMGSNVARLKSVAEEEGWRVMMIWEHGENPSAWTQVQGDTVVRVHLGNYRGLFLAAADSYWAFDESGRMVALRVERTADAP